MVLFSLFTIITVIGLYSSLFTIKQLNRVAIIVLLLSGVLAFHAMWVGQLGEASSPCLTETSSVRLDSGVGIFNGIFHMSNLFLGIDLFIYIVASFILLMSEIFNVNKAGPRPARRASGSLNTSSEVHSDSQVEDNLSSYMSGIPQGTLKIIQEYPIIIIFSVLGISCLISSNDLITIFLSFELQSWAVFILALVVLFLLFPVIIIIHFLFMGFISLYLQFNRAISFSAGLLLFLLGEVIDPAMTAKALGHQWYWNSDYLDFLDEVIDPAMTAKALGLKLY